MIQRHKRFSLLLAIFVGSSFLSACSGIKSFAPSAFPSSAPSKIEHKEKIVSPVSSAGELPDLVPLTTDSETCLQRELDALRNTGAWGNSIQPPSNIKFGGIIHYDFPITLNKQVEMYIHFFQNDERNTFGRWLSRSRRYLPMIQKDLKSAGLPLDLAYLAMIESGFNQRAYSSSRATGLWQFMKKTARDYHLRVNSYVDERRNAEKSTKAAVAMLSDLYSQFNDWYLAVAAYNAGAGKISAGLKKYHVKTFSDLARKHYLSLETIRYVPKLLAAIIVAKDPEKFGFGNIKYLSPLEYDTLEVGPGMGLDGIALITHSSKEKIRQLNPELIAGKTPWRTRKFEVKIPAGTQEMAQNNLPRLRSVVSTDYRTHVLTRHESVAAVCRKYRINKKDLLKANNLRSGRLVAGQHLRIPVHTSHYILLPPKATMVAKNGGDVILHKVRPGDTINGIAHQYHLRPELVLVWNHIKNARNLQIGQELVLYVVNNKQGHSAKLVTVASSHNHGVIHLSPKVHNSSVDLASHRKIRLTQTAQETFRYYKIERGDTLWNISQRFNTTPEQIKTWNNLKSNIIHPGDKLKVKEANQIVAERSDNTVL
jgi:membrane-bound lytic murein transglycosylase D